MKCPGLVPGIVTLAATKPCASILQDATGLARGVSRSLLFSLEREAPRGKPVASKRLLTSDLLFLIPVRVARLHVLVETDVDSCVCCARELAQRIQFPQAQQRWMGRVSLGCLGAFTQG